MVHDLELDPQVLLVEPLTASMVLRLLSLVQSTQQVPQHDALELHGRLPSQHQVQVWLRGLPFHPSYDQN
jgi:hypothetical protein